MNSKMSRLGPIPSDWWLGTVQDAVDEDYIYKPLDGNHGSIHPKSADFTASGIPFIMASDIIGGKIDLIGCNFLSEEQASKLQKGFSQTGDVLLTHKGSVGLVAVVPKIDSSYIMLTPQVTYYRVKDALHVDNIFTKYLFLSRKFQDLLDRFSGGGTRAYIGISAQRKLPFYLPKINEQQRITSVLQTWDLYLEKLDKKIELKSNIKKGLMRALLGGTVRINGFSKSWRVVRLGDISHIKTGKKDNQNKVKNGAYPFFVRSPNIERIDSYSFDGEAILIPGEGNIGKIFHYIDGKFDFHQRVYKISDFDKSANGRYIHYYFTENFAREVSSGSVKATVDSLRLPTFTNFKINLPPIEEQLAIVRLLDTIDQDIYLLKSKKSALENQREYLINNLITGKMRTPENLTVGTTEASHA